MTAMEGALVAALIRCPCLKLWSLFSVLVLNVAVVVVVVVEKKWRVAKERWPPRLAMQRRSQPTQ